MSSLDQMSSDVLRIAEDGESIVCPVCGPSSPNDFRIHTSTYGHRNVYVQDGKAFLGENQEEDEEWETVHHYTCQHDYVTEFEFEED